MKNRRRGRLFLMAMIGIGSLTVWSDIPKMAAAEGDVREESQETMLMIEEREDLKRELQESIQQFRQPEKMEISALNLENPEIEVKNMYYEILREFPELKYAYQLIPWIQDGKLSCHISYMPYKTGEFPEDFSGEEVGSMEELLDRAADHLGEEQVAIRITNPQMEPDRMNRALQQVGGGYLLCMLKEDGTAIQYDTPPDKTMEECMQALETAEKLADQVFEKLITDQMTEREKAEVLYSYLTENVSYDQRYKTDKASMPYESQTALGALQNQTAICGGYANALKLLYEKAGIPCYTVSGKYFQEPHMWNLAELDGQWLWFDATLDQGNSSEYGFLRFALTELDEMKYHYDEEEIRWMTEKNDVGKE